MKYNFAARFTPFTHSYRSELNILLVWRLIAKMVLNAIHELIDRVCLLIVLPHLTGLKKEQRCCCCCVWTSVLFEYSHTCNRGHSMFETENNVISASRMRSSSDWLPCHQHIYTHRFWWKDVLWRLEPERWRSESLPLEWSCVYKMYIMCLHHIDLFSLTLVCRIFIMPLVKLQIVILT